MDHRSSDEYRKMSQASLAVTESSLLDVFDKDSGTEWFGSAGGRSWATVIDGAGANEDIARLSDNEESPTSRSSSEISERLQNAIDAFSTVKAAPLRDRFVVLQEWEGLVCDISEGAFVARLIDVTRKGSPDEEADFLIEDLREDDRVLLRQGAIFRWVIGYDTKRDGTKRRASQLVFRRLPQWTRKEIDEADNQAKYLASTIEWQ